VPKNPLGRVNVASTMQTIAATPAHAWWSAKRSIATNTIAAMPNAYG
jgi:hypothetical protein